MARQPNDQIARDWRSQARSPHTWKPCADQTGVKTGEAGGYKVEADGFDRVCYLKPANAHGDEATHCRAAREKIASDLSYDLGLGLPPAQLTIRDAPPPGCTPHVVISLLQYSKQWPWSAIKAVPVDESPTGAALAQALSRCSPLLAFDTWTDQQDHNDHPDNIVWGYDPSHLGASAIIFLDYANSMGFGGSWAAGGWQNVTKPQWMPLMLQHLNAALLRQTVERIENFEEAAIRDIVNRVPDDYLSQAHKTTVLDGLLGRRGLIRNVLKTELQGA